jgi:hypothetical protein
MKKYKIEEKKIYGLTISYYIKFKTKWWPFWRYLKKSDKTAACYKTRKAAQGYINLLNNKK